MDRKHRQLGNLALAFLLLLAAWVGALHLLPDEPTRSVLIVVLGMAFVVAFVTLLVAHIRGLLRGDRFRLHGVLVLAELVLLFLGFAAAYQELGVIDSTLQGGPVVHDFWLGAYLSVATFTSVGYGDITPVGLGRILAALQGFTGYLVLGVLASTAASVLSPYTEAGPKNDGEAQREEGGG